MVALWHVVIRVGQPTDPLVYVFPHAGGSGYSYKALAEALRIPAEVRAIALPGRDGRIGCAPIQRMKPLVDALVEAVPIPQDRRVLFLGHSTGALVGFEFARRLSRLQRPGPCCLIASGRGAPGRGPRRLEAYRLPDATLVDELRHYGGTPPEVLENPELLELVLPALRADLEISATTAVPQPEALACRITAVAGREDPDVSLADLEAWAPWAGGGLHCELMAGGHFYLWSSQQFTTLLAQEISAA